MRWEGVLARALQGRGPGPLRSLPCVLASREPASLTGGSLLCARAREDEGQTVYTAPSVVHRLRRHCSQPTCTLEGLTLQSPSVSLGIRLAPSDPPLPWRE